MRLHRKHTHMKNRTRTKTASANRIVTMNTPSLKEAEPAVVYETENDLPKKTRAELNVLINQRLADIIDLQMQLKQAHWNVKGPHFIGLHELFDKIAEEVES
jgi:ferritin-like protein